MLLHAQNEELVRTLANSKNGGSIWLGEHHNSAIDHNFQELFIRMLHKGQRELGRKDQPIAVGLEQVQVQFQPFLDDYVKGKISLEEMRRLVEWDKRWTWNFEGYKGIFEAARELDNVRLLALNVNSEDLAKVEKGGYPNLPIDQLRKYIKDPIGFGTFAKTRQFQTYVDYVIGPSYEIHRNLGLLKYTISGEQLDSEMPFRNFLSGRILWDEGMASVAHSWVSKTGGLLVGLVGADHVKFRNGIPARFLRLSANSNFDCTTLVINPTLIDSRPSGSVSNFPGSDSSKTPELITLQLRYLKDNIDSANSEMRHNPESTGGVLPFADYIVIT
jgi:Haem-binding uptake, Tiki superfamily, ChaN